MAEASTGVANLQVTIKEAKDIIRVSMKSHFDRIDQGLPIINSPIFLHSSPGLGKSSVTRQVNDEFDEHGFVDLRLGQIEASEVNGIAYVSHAGLETETMKMSIPDWFPQDPNWRGTIFYDEISNAALPIQHASYGQIHDRRLHQRKFPAGAFIMAAGNLKSDKTGVKNVVPALANRFGIHLFIKPSVAAWNEYAAERGLHPQVVGYLNWKNDMLLKVPQSGETAWPSPRTWEAVSNHLYTGFTESQLAFVLSGAVGTATATDFQGYLRYQGQFPNMLRIANGEEEFDVPKNDLGLLFAVTSSLYAAFIEHVDDKAKVKNLAKVLAQLDDDFLVLFYKQIQATQNERLMMLIPQYTIDIFRRVTRRVKSNG